GVPDVPSNHSEEEILWNSSDDEDVNDKTEGRNDNEGEKTDESDDDDDQDEAEKVNDNDDDEEEISKIDEQEATESVEGDDEETGGSRGLQVSQDIDDSHVTLTPVHSDGQQESSSMSSFVTNLLNPIIDPDRVKSLEVNFSEFMRTNKSQEAVSNIPSIVHQYMHQEMTEAIREAIQIQTDRLQDSLLRENDEFLRTIDDNMKKIIKEQVKSQVKEQVTRILPRIEESVNAQLEAEILTRSSHSSRTSYAVAADLSEMELKKILIDKMEGNKSIQGSDEQQNLYKALVDAYEVDKTILDSYGESTILKRRREDDDDQEGPSAGSDRGSKRQREGGEHASASTPF
nr:hypothetical protein [Tanacetum cinerariifolium]